MNKIFIKDNSDNHLLDSYTVSNPHIAIEQFRALMNRRIPNAVLYIDFRNGNSWIYDLRPRTPDAQRWRAKDDPFTGVSLIPQYAATAEITALFNITRATLTTWKREGKLVEFFDYVKGLSNGRSAFLYDPKSIERILAEKPRNKK